MGTSSLGGGSQDQTWNSPSSGRDLFFFPGVCDPIRRERGSEGLFFLKIYFVTSATSQEENGVGKAFGFGPGTKLRAWDKQMGGRNYQRESWPQTLLWALCNKLRKFGNSNQTESERGVRGEADDWGTSRKKMWIFDMENILNFGLEEPAAPQLYGCPFIDFLAMDVPCWLLQEWSGDVFLVFTSLRQNTGTAVGRNLWASPPRGDVWQELHPHTRFFSELAAKISSNFDFLFTIVSN